MGGRRRSAHDWNGFLQRLTAELARYRALGIGYADSAFAPAFDVTAGREGMLRVALSNQASFGEIRYTTDGSAPTSTSTQYVRPLEFSAQGKVTLRAATFEPGGFDLAAPRTQGVGCLDSAQPRRQRACSLFKPAGNARERRSAGTGPEAGLHVGCRQHVLAVAPGATCRDRTRHLDRRARGVALRR